MMNLQRGDNNHAVLMLHGLCGSPLELGSIPRMLQRMGCTVAWPDLPGYDNPDPAKCTSWRDWIASAELALAELQKTHASVSVCGLSMGATLGLALAERHSDIQSLVLLSPILRYDGWAISRPLLALLRVAYFFGIRNWVWRETEPYGIRNPELQRRVAKAVTKGEVSEVGAATLSARHLYQALQLMKDVHDRLSEVTTDTLVMHAVDDETAAPRNAEEILAGIRSEVRKAFWLGDCYHIITVDNEREVVTNEVLRFIEAGLTRQSGTAYRPVRQRQTLRDRR